MDYAAMDPPFAFPPEDARDAAEPAPRAGSQPFAPAFGARKTAAGGILYIDDFDAPEQPPSAAASQAKPAPASPPVYTRADMDEARGAGRLAGLEEARGEIASVQGDLRVAALQALADAADASRSDLRAVAEGHAGELAAAMLAILVAALPAATARHARSELEAVILALLPGLRCEPELKVRVHPDLVDFTETTLARLLADSPAEATVREDGALALGDVAITWLDGGATRDCAALWNHIALALAPIGLPSFEEIANGRRF